MRDETGRDKRDTADKRAAFRPVRLSALCLVVSSRESSSWPSGATALERERERKKERKRGGEGGGLPLRMTPPWPFSTSPHCASTEPCGDTRSLASTEQARRSHFTQMFTRAAAPFNRAVMNTWNPSHLSRGALWVSFCARDTFRS